MTQATLAEALTAHGVSMNRAAVAKVECGARRLSLDEALAVCLVLDLNLSDLVCDGPLVMETVVD